MVSGEDTQMKTMVYKDIAFIATVYSARSSEASVLQHAESTVAAGEKDGLWKITSV